MDVRSSLSSRSHAFPHHDREEGTSAVLSATTTETPGDTYKNTHKHTHASDKGEAVVGGRKKKETGKKEGNQIQQPFKDEVNLSADYRSRLSRL